MTWLYLTLWGTGAALIAALAVTVVAPLWRRFSASDKAGRNEFWLAFSIVAAFALWSAAIWAGLRFAEYNAVKCCAPMVVIPAGVDLRRWRERKATGRWTAATVALRVCAFALLLVLAIPDFDGDWRGLALGELGGFVCATAAIWYVESLMCGAGRDPSSTRSASL